MREEVQKFAELMETKIAAHDAERGQGWKGAAAWQLYKRLEEEVYELRIAILAKQSPSEVAAEAADVANLAMMVADVAGGLE